MTELTQKQRQAIAVAQARLRLKQKRVQEVGTAMAEKPNARVEGAFADVAAAAEPVSRTRAVVEGLTQGATLGFGDEIGAALDLPLSTLLSGGARNAYNANLAERRADLEAAQAQRPALSTIGEIGGAIATAPVMPIAKVAQGAGMLARIGAGARTGAAYGAGYGAGTGEGLEDRAVQALQGAGVGAITGGAVPLAVGAVQGTGKAIGAGASALAAPVRAILNPEKEAIRRVVVAKMADDSLPLPKLSLADEQAALVNGQPLMNIDRGGEATRSLARKAANESPLARATLKNPIDDRFQNQSGRVVSVVRRIAGNSRSIDNRMNLQRQARAVNRPNYKVAYNSPAAQSVWDDALDQISTAPVVQDAIKQAAVTGRNSAALDGFPPLTSPFVIDKASGRVNLKEGVTPTLQFWDHVKRNLDGVGTPEAKRAAKVLREHLDAIVPEYKTARAGAASYFDAEDALEAGEKFVASRMDNDTARALVTKMSDPEKKLFMEGFADQFVRSVSETGDTRNVMNSILRSPAARERVEIAMGPQKAKELEAFVHIEGMMNQAREAFGGSQTARNLAELGVAGAAGGGYGLLTGDWQGGGAAVLAGMLARKGQKTGIAFIEKGVAQRIGELLASPDPKKVQIGIRTITSNPRYMDALRTLDLPAAAGASQVATEALVN